MAYTFWHSGVLIGESDMDELSDRPGQRGGIFRPTAYGLEVFPRLSGILSAGHALKTHLDAHGLSPDEMDPDEIDELLDTTAAGQQIIDIGRTLSEVEMRGPDGERLEFASIGFSDLLELKRLAREMEPDTADDREDLSADDPRYIVSATLRDPTRVPDDEGQADGFRQTQSPDDNRGGAEETRPAAAPNDSRVRPAAMNHEVTRGVSAAATLARRRTSGCRPSDS